MAMRARSTTAALRTVLIALLALWTLVSAATDHAAAERNLVWARSGDALTLDPHAINEGPTLTLLRQIYEPLVALDSAGRLEAALATSWSSRDNEPTVWQFRLREGVTFHDGTPLTPDDVLFSLQRARHEKSDMRGLLSGIKDVRRIGEATVLVETAVPDPLLPISLSHILILSRKWAEAEGLLEPRTPNAASPESQVSRANGTGAFRLERREIGVETELVAAPSWWGWGNAKPRLSRVIFRPIADEEQRVAELLSGRIDFLQDVPVGAVASLRSEKALRLNVGPDNRVLFLGLNTTGALRTGEARGAPNPLADRRVRVALNLAIDREAIQRDVMNGQALATAVLAPPLINGYPRELDRVAKPDLVKAKALLAEAGYPDGFAITLHCTNDRYLNDAGICSEVAAELSAIGVRATPILQSKSQHFPLIRSGGADMYLLGWGVPTFDSAYILHHLFHSRTSDSGSWNGTGFSDHQVDTIITLLKTESNRSARSELISQLWTRLHEEVIYLPLHVQTLTYAMTRDIDIPVDATNKPRLTSIVIPTDTATAGDRPATPGSPTR